MKEPHFWYVVHTRTNSEPRVVKDVSEAFSRMRSEYDILPFCPESEYYYRGSAAKGRCYRRRALFPGYVFLETDMPPHMFLKEFSQYIYDSPDIIRLLRYGASGNIALDDEERRRFEFLFKDRRCFEHSEGYIEGDKIIVTAGPLVGHEGLITRINRHNRLATIALDMFGGRTEADVALEIVNKL